jgi:hypothetical protein
MIDIRVWKVLQSTNLTGRKPSPFRSVNGNHGHGDQSGGVRQISDTDTRSTKRPQTILQGGFIALPLEFSETARPMGIPPRRL